MMKQLRFVLAAILFVGSPVSAQNLDCDGETVATINANGLEYEVDVKPNCMSASTSGWLLAAVTNEILDQILLDQPYEDRAFVFDVMMDEFIHTLKTGY